MRRVEGYRPVILAVLDGWGFRGERRGNAIAAAALPVWRDVLQRWPHTLLEASGEAVGLPKGVMGNSEVGHMNLGSGRVVPQGVTIIDAAIADGELPHNETLRRAFAHLATTKGTLHLMGLLSDGRVHSSMEHLFALIEASAAVNVPIAIHAFLDGRDTPPRSAIGYAERLDAKLCSVDRAGSIADVTGRYYAMDRDRRWERTRRAYELLANGDAEYRANDALDAIRMGYERDEGDEFVAPTIVREPRPIEDGDAFIFFNFRPDRARQLLTAFNAGTDLYYDDGFGVFPSKRYRNPFFATMTKYEEQYTNPVLFAARPQYDTFGEIAAREGLRQLRLAETEKYAHVTYFFNGGREDQFEGEDRDLIPSDRSVATYDIAPAMRAREITDAAIAAIRSEKYDAIVMNYANADMLGHTGKWQPTIEGLEIVDESLGRLVDATLQANGLLAITADHGNAEEEIDGAGNPITAHTTNPVPFVLIGNDLHGTLADGGKLGDVAPTLLRIMGLPVPERMTGRNLFTGQSQFILGLLPASRESIDAGGRNASKPQ